MVENLDKFLDQRIFQIVRNHTLHLEGAIDLETAAKGKQRNESPDIETVLAQL